MKSNKSGPKSEKKVPKEMKKSVMKESENLSEKPIQGAKEYLVMDISQGDDGSFSIEQPITHITIPNKQGVSVPTNDDEKEGV